MMEQRLLRREPVIKLSAVGLALLQPELMRGMADLRLGWLWPHSGSRAANGLGFGGGCHVHTIARSVSARSARFGRGCAFFAHSENSNSQNPRSLRQTPRSDLPRIRRC